MKLAKWMLLAAVAAGTAQAGFDITAQPQDRTVAEGGSATFSVSVTNDTVLTVSLGSGKTLEMVWIEPGTFSMGSPEDELGRFRDEARHEVAITHGFWMGRYELTQAQYAAQMGSNPSRFQGDDRPVDHVSWYDALNFCSRLTAHERSAGRLSEGYEFMVPTEAQWEYACRAGTSTALNGGKDLSNVNECPEMDEVGWYQYNSDNATHSAGEKPPNAWGLHDMHGNVREWCWDWYENDYSSANSVDPDGPGTGEYRVLRGGDWGKTAQNCRSAYRTHSNPSVEDWDDVGFRVVLVRSTNITVPLAEGVDLEMVRIDHGAFEMGSPADELGRADDETPHDVVLTRDFWIGKYEITQDQYLAVTGTNPSRFQGGGLPVENASWDDATNFCAMLTARERAAGRLPAGHAYTLPTEAQWEYACRRGTRTALNTWRNLTNGEECYNMDDAGWYKYNGENATHPGGQLKPNRGREMDSTFGPKLARCNYDFHGNVAEWCLDRYGAYPDSAATDPAGPDAGGERVVRGGSWADPAKDCRSATRGRAPQNAAADTVGFRVALAVVSPDEVAPPSAENGMAPSYQWLKDGAAIAGATSASYTVSGAGTGDAGSYSVVVSTMLGSVRSAAAVLTVNSEPPAVSNVVARQRWPWNGLVDVDYEVGGSSNKLAALEARISFAASDGRSWTASNFLAGAEPSTGPGPHRATWDTEADGATNVVAESVVATVSLVRTSEAEPRWCVVDLSGGADAASYSVAYFAEPPASGWNAGAYKTTNLLLRLVKPSDWADGTFTAGGTCETTLTNAYWIGVFETTQRQWELVTGGRPSYFRRDDCYATRPVERVSYDTIRGSDAGSQWPDSGEVDEDSFLGRLRARTGLGFDLPTEAQWEFACRAGTTTDYNSGKDWTGGNSCANMGEVGRYAYNGGSAGEDCDPSGGTAVAGTYLPNRWGLYDFHGNVYEWCLDWFGGLAASAVEPVGAPSGSKRVLRGGNCGSFAKYCSSADRFSSEPNKRYIDVGFRLCLPAGPEPAP